MNAYVAVVGGINVDLIGVPTQPLIPATSNPGTISLSAGGVGRNIAHNLALLGVPVYLFGVVGDDALSAHVLTETAGAGVHMEYIRVVPQRQTGLYVSVQDVSGDLAVAISDMQIIQTLDLAYIEAHRSFLQQSRLMVADTNLESEVLQAVLDLCEEADIPCLIEPVSAAKAQKLHALTTVCDYITPNLLELGVLNQQPLEQTDRLENACRSIASRYRHILVTLGAQGVYHYDRERASGAVYPAIPTQVVETTGAGDAFVAGLVCGLFRGLPMKTSIPLGMAAASLTLQTRHPVNYDLSFERCFAFMTTTSRSPEKQNGERLSPFFPGDQIARLKEEGR